MSLILNSGLGIGGGSGSDKHNLGWYADPEALSTAHPEGTDGDYAVVGSTDTVWVWDSDSTAWVDTDTKGQVTTVNGQTGDVTVQETLVSQSNIKSINGNSLLGSGNINTEVIQVNSMPTAASNPNRIVQYTGTTTENYTNGYFYTSIPTYTEDSATVTSRQGNTGTYTDLAINVNTYKAYIESLGDLDVDMSLQYHVTSDHTSATLYMPLSNVTLQIDDSILLPFLDTYFGSVTNIAYISLTSNGENDWGFTAYYIGGETSGENIVDAQLISRGITWDSSAQFVSGDISDNLYIIHGQQYWTRTDNGNMVDLATCGITWTSASPVTGDYLDVSFVEGGDISGYNWAQLNVQPAGAKGIEWVDTVDLPADYSGDSWSASPGYIIEGGLPDGIYEFYTSTGMGTGEWPRGNVVFKYRVEIDNINYTAKGEGIWVLDGQSLIDANTKLTNYYYVYPIYKKANGDILLWNPSTPWSTDIPAYYSIEDPHRGQEECFKISALINIETGDKYIPTNGTLYNNNNLPDYANQYSGGITINSLVDQPHVPTYHSISNAYINSENQYIRIQPSIAISYYDENTGGAYCAMCSELDISLKSESGGKWHAIIENAYDSYIGRILEATGDLANVQIGWDNYDYSTVVFVNNTNLNEYIQGTIGTKGSSEAANFWGQNLYGNFIPATLTRVTPGTATKVTFDSAGIITAAANLQESDIPSLSLTKISDVTATSTEVNKLHGVTVTSNEINYLDGVSSNIQNQLTNKVVFRQWTTTTEEPGE